MSDKKVLFTGKTHTTRTSANGAGEAHSKDGFLDIKLPQSHPEAENLFGVAWSACYMGALEHAAAAKKIKLSLPIAVDAQIDLNIVDGAFFSDGPPRCQSPGCGPRRRGRAHPSCARNLSVLESRSRQHRHRNQSRLAEEIAMKVVKAKGTNYEKIRWCHPHGHGPDRLRRRAY